MNIRSLLHRTVSSRTRRRIRRCLGALGWEHRFLRLRRTGFAKLHGEGIEIGAFEHPAPLPYHCRTRYVDAIAPAEAAALFPEIDAASLVIPDYILDVSSDGLAVFTDAQWDYVVACHVIEHLPNPGRFVRELFRIVRSGGFVVIAAPDKRFTFDATRPETPLAVLHRYFSEGRVTTLSDYEDISHFVNTSDLALPKGDRLSRLQSYFDRREHLNVWTSVSFRQFWINAMQWSSVAAVPIYEIDGDQSRFEYFGVWQKQ